MDNIHEEMVSVKSMLDRSEDFNKIIESPVLSRDLQKVLVILRWIFYVFGIIQFSSSLFFLKYILEELIDVLLSSCDYHV